MDERFEWKAWNSKLQQEDTMGRFLDNNLGKDFLELNQKQRQQKQKSTEEDNEYKEICSIKEILDKIKRLIHTEWERILVNIFNKGLK